MLRTYRRKTRPALIGGVNSKRLARKNDPSDKDLYITELGESQLTAFGVDLSQIKA